MLHGKLQGAMEYLMTYGWAILVIAVVLGALYQLGVFGSGSANLGSSCLTSTGFICQTPVLNSSGFLAVKFGQISTGGITITSLGCSANASAPSSSEWVNLQIVSGATVGLSFSCPLASSAIGTPFKGYLWLTYSTATQSGIVDKVAVVSTKVSLTGNSLAALKIGSNAGGYVPPVNLYCIAGSPLTNRVEYGTIYQSAIGTFANSANSYGVVDSGITCSAYSGYIYCASGAVAGTYSAPIISGGFNGAFTAQNALPGANNGNSCTTYNGYFYCMGGGGTSVYYSAISGGSIGTFTSANAYPVSVTQSSCTIYAGYIYCVAGSLASNTYYAQLFGNGAVGAWSSTTSYPLAVSKLNCQSSAGYIYCIGGINGGGLPQRPTYYATISSGGIGAWQAGTLYPELQSGSGEGVDGQGCAIYNTNIYCAGGDDGSTSRASTYYAAISSLGIGTWVNTNSLTTGTSLTTCVIG